MLMSQSLSVNALPSLARHTGQARETMVHLGHDAVEGAFGDGRVAAKAMQDLALPLEVLEQVGFEVGARADVHDLEDGRQGVVVVDRRFTRHQLGKPPEQVFEAQVGPDALVEGVFVEDHAVFSGRPIIARSVSASCPMSAASCAHESDPSSTPRCLLRAAARRAWPGWR
jgi:hypothetical protein